MFDTVNGYNENQDETFKDVLKQRFQEWNDLVFVETNENVCPGGDCSGLEVTVGRDPETDGTAVALYIEGLP